MRPISTFCTSATDPTIEICGMLQRIPILFLTIALPLITIAQELPRRAFLGIRMEALTDDVRRIIGIGDVNGVLVAEVIPNSTAAEAGWKKGDVLTTIGESKVASIDEVLAALAQFQSGDQFNYRLHREGKEVKGKAKLKGWAYESYPGLEMEYSSFRSQIGTQRSIIAKGKRSKDRKLPVIVFIGGLGCYSLDTPQDTARSETQLLNTLARNGYLAVRAEKPGIGDGARTSKACNEVSISEEVASYVQLIKDLKRRPDVDSSDITIFGHSMGGLMAPMIAQHTPVQKLIAYGTFGSSILEYLPKTRRTIGEAYGWDLDSTEKYINDFNECATWYFADRMTSEEVAKKKPICAEMMGVFDLRSRAYMDELYQANVAGLWRAFNGKALFMYGESDYIASREDHEILQQVMDKYHPGNGTLKIIPATDHGMNSAADFKAAATSPCEYNPQVGKIVLEWMRSTK